MGSRRLLLGVVVLTGCLAACSGVDQEEDTSDDGVSALRGSWETIDTGVAYTNTGDGPGVFISYAGYSVHDAWSQAWTEELHRKRLKDLGVGHIYAVRGPRDAGYAAREIGNSKLAAHLLSGPAADAPFVLVAAHSSGSYVAHELLANLAHDPSESIKGKIVYANLDGGGTGLDAHVVGALRHVAFVWAEDDTLSSGRSANAGTMESLGARYGDTSVRISADASGCSSNARWCMHDTLITTRPHDPARYDLQRDYTDFRDRPVQTAWIDAVASFLH